MTGAFGHIIFVLITSNGAPGGVKAQGHIINGLMSDYLIRNFATYFNLHLL